MKDIIRSMLVMIELELRRLKHDRTEMYYRAVQPVLWILVFGPVMASIRGAVQMGGSSVPYTAFITPGIMIQSAVFVAIFYGLTLVWERDSGILKKLLVTPASRYGTVIGRSMASGVRAIIQGLIVIPFALIIGVVIFPNPFYFLLAFVIIFFSSGGFAAISIIMASFMKTRERFMGLGQAITMPLFFLSSALYPLSNMGALQYIAAYNPMTYIVEAVRSLLITGDLSTLPLDLLVILVFVVVMYILAAISFKRIIE
ncbi:MAG TPA: ABC transporter permease [Candidatus Lokiarchaeia archaeon]|nr:ABC transporter permease [Candidatus Lokiarchaeia archaeon]